MSSRYFPIFHTDVVTPRRPAAGYVNKSVYVNSMAYDISNREGCQERLFAPRHDVGLRRLRDALEIEGASIFKFEWFAHAEFTHRH